MGRADDPWHSSGELQPLPRHTEIGWLDLIPDAVSAGGDGREAGRASADERIKDDVAREGKEFDQAFGKVLRVGRGMPATGGLPLDVEPGGAEP